MATQKLDKNKPLWEIHILENYNKDSSIMCFVFQHSLLDAVGFVSFISAILDTQFSLRMKKKFTKISLKWKIICLIFGPLYTAYMSTRFKMFKSDKEAARMTEKTNYNTYQKNLYCTREIDFEKVKK